MSRSYRAHDADVRVLQERLVSRGQARLSQRRRGAGGARLQSVGGETQGDDLTAKVRNWLNGQGAPFEMLTARSFAQSGTHVQQGRYLIDPDTGKSREVDVVAGKQTVLVD